MSLPSGRSHVKAEEQRARCVNKRRWAHLHGPTVGVRQHGSDLFDEPKAARTQAKRGGNNMALPACGVPWTGTDPAGCTTAAQLLQNYCTFVRNLCTKTIFFKPRMQHVFCAGNVTPTPPPLLLRSNTQGADKEQITIILSETWKQAGVEGAWRDRTHWWQSLAAAAVAFENIHYRQEASALPPWFERTLVLVVRSHLYTWGCVLELVLKSCFFGIWPNCFLLFEAVRGRRMGGGTWRCEVCVRATWKKKMQAERK